MRANATDSSSCVGCVQQALAFCTVILRTIPHHPRVSKQVNSQWHIRFKTGLHRRTLIDAKQKNTNALGTKSCPLDSLFVLFGTTKKYTETSKRAKARTTSRNNRSRLSDRLKPFPQIDEPCGSTACGNKFETELNSTRASF